MGMLWAVQPLVLIVGVVLAALIAREAGGVRSDLRDELARLGEIQAAVAEVRAESALSHRHVQHLRYR